MAPGTHAAISWCVANVATLSKRDRFLVFVTGMSPDLDGLGFFVSTLAYQRWHHVLCHNLTFGLICTALVGVFARQRRLTMLLAFVAFHLHLAADYFGSAGPNHDVWVLPYLYPLIGSASSEEMIGPAWYCNPWQWELNAWPSVATTIACFLLSLYIAIRLDRTPFEFVLPAFDRDICKSLRKWLGGEASSEWSMREARWLRRGLVAVCVVVIWACILAGMQA